MTHPSPQPEPPLQSNLAFGPPRPDNQRPDHLAPAPPPPPPLPDTSWSGVGPVWFQRMSVFIFVLFSIQLGILVTALPWWTRLWDQNAYLLAHPHLLAILELGPVRGIISGFGLLDIWIGISEAIEYRDRRPPPAT